MATNASLWTFYQLGGERKKLELRDHAAPHGRPRQGAVAEPGMELRQAEVYYSGGAPPTRHLFGIRNEPIELSGRWSDIYGGKGFARGKLDEVKSFFADEQPVIVVWSDLVRFRGLITRLTPGIESAGEVTWSMEIKVDADSYLDRPFTLPDPVEPESIVNRLLEIADRKNDLLDLPLNGNIFDALDGLISSLNQVTSELNRVVDQIDALATAPLALLKRLRAAMRTARNLLIRLRGLVDSWDAAYALEAERARDQRAFWDVQSALSVSIIQTLRDIARVDESSQAIERNRLKTIYFAQQGDTWELISLKIYGAGSRAADIQAANSVAPGAQPTAGTAYQIPL